MAKLLRPGETGPLTKLQVLEDEFRALHGRLPDGYEAELKSIGDNLPPRKLADAKLAAFIRAVHTEAPQAALCLSGGGIRSASFALGVLQGLARCGLLKRFDYLSTVSGGGYIGSWLSGWIHRAPHGTAGVRKALGEPDPETCNPETHQESARRLTPEPDEVRHLREYSNYLTPHAGLLKPDAVTLIATYIRNLLLNWIVLAPLVIGLVLLPRFYVALLYARQFTASSTTAAYTLLSIGQFLLMVAITVPILAMPGKRRRAEAPDTDADDRPRKQGPGTPAVLAGAIAPVFGCGIVLALLAAWGGYPLVDRTWRSISWFSVFALSPVLAVGLRRLLKRGAPIDGWTVFGLVISGIIIGQISVAVMGTDAMQKFAAHPRVFAILRVPATFMIYFFLTTLYVGFTSGRPGGDDDREWWARLMALTLFFAVVWAAAVGVVLAGPMIFKKWWNLMGAVPIVPSVLITIFAAFSGHSESTSPRDADARNILSRVLQALPAVLGTIAVPIFFVFASFAVDEMIQHGDWSNTWFGKLTHLDIRDGLCFNQWGTLAVAATPLPDAWVTILRLFVAIVAILAVSGLLMNFNRFSLHAMYRDRLIRAFLGASNRRRVPDAFTGFDSEDNIPLHHLRRGRIFICEDLGDEQNVVELAKLLTEAPREFLRHVRKLAGQYHDALATELTEYLWRKEHADGPRPEQQPLRHRLLAALNCVVVQPELAAFTPNQPQDPANAEPDDIRRARRALEADRSPTLLNRLLLEEHCFVEKSGTIPPQRTHLLKPRQGVPELARPLHIVNMALNLVDSRALALQYRKAESFTASPLHCGFATGYRRSDEYGGPMSLGTAMTISGAAASPNMGYHSSPAVTLLMTLFNIRLGWWLGNPALRVTRWFRRFLPEVFWPTEVYRRSDPRNSVLPLINEALGRTNDRYSYVYLSDGGHFDNLGLYEMVARRCRFIVVSDASCDPGHKLQDLANAIRRVQNDMNITISMREVHIFDPKNKGKSKGCRYCAVGEIRYRDADKGEAKNGVLIYLKPALHPFLPVDVFNQSQVDCRFPHEPTSNQWFSDAQFESYRKLGLAIVEHLAERARLIADVKDEEHEDALLKIVADLDDASKHFARAAIRDAFSRPEKKRDTMQQDTVQQPAEPADQPANAAAKMARELQNEKIGMALHPTDVPRIPPPEQPAPPPKDGAPLRTEPAGSPAATDRVAVNVVLVNSIDAPATNGNHKAPRRKKKV